MPHYKGYIDRHHRVRGFPEPLNMPAKYQKELPFVPVPELANENHV